MNINVCIPTRWKPELLNDFVREMILNATLSTTRFVIAIDEDEEAAYSSSQLQYDPRVIWSVGPREDSLGEKYQRCVKACPADVYVMATDDLAITQKRWDLILGTLISNFEDGYGLVGVGKNWTEPYMPAMQAMTHKYMEAQGFFCAPYFPFWWHDTWNLEVSEYCGRYIFWDVPIRYPEKDPPSARSDIAYWAQVYDDLQPMRVEIADTILKRAATPKWIMFKILSSRTASRKHYLERNSILLDPQFALALGTGDQMVDPRIVRLKMRAELMRRIWQSKAA